MNVKIIIEVEGQYLVKAPPHAAHAVGEQIKFATEAVFDGAKIADALAAKGLADAAVRSVACFVASENPARIPATITSDDADVEVPFDAGFWIESASEDDLTALAEGRFGGCELTDEIAYAACDVNEEVAGLFSFIGLAQRYKPDAGGFTCRLNGKSVVAFVREKCPSLYATWVAEGIVAP
ncbi:MAG: hypothetical protein E6Q76_14285 [Rhizobium sp.]|nr:MAG: hypothetical protein E6Q76_14285 [Rhizobium sp.]